MNSVNRSDILNRLSKSKFRSSFKLTSKDIEYIDRIGLVKIESHARDFIKEKLVPGNPKNDGKQTPFKGHPVFKAQHATATCCRSCLEKWHRIGKNKLLAQDEQDFIISIIMDWIKIEYNRLRACRQKPLIV